MADVEVAEQPPPPSNTYVIRPNFQHKFRPVIVKECIHNVLNEHLDGKTYDPEEIMDWTKAIADNIKTKLKGTPGKPEDVKMKELKTSSVTLTLSKPKDDGGSKIDSYFILLKEDDGEFKEVAELKSYHSDYKIKDLVLGICTEMKQWNEDGKSIIVPSVKRPNMMPQELEPCLDHNFTDMGYDRYKFVVQVAIGEQRGEGVKMGARCFWDSDTDNYAQDIYINDSLFCVAAAFGVFYY